MCQFLRKDGFRTRVKYPFVGETHARLLVTLRHNRVPGSSRCGSHARAEVKAGYQLIEKRGEISSGGQGVKEDMVREKDGIEEGR